MRAALILSALLLASPALAGDVIPGPVYADVLDVYDGDTITVSAHVWLDQRITTKVRLVGLNTPEIRGKCADEVQRAEAARAALVKLVGARVLLYRVTHDKYAGRVDATVVNEDAKDVAEEMLAAGHARRYGGGKRAGWCS
jgi:micrococcal nuclease